MKALKLLVLASSLLLMAGCQKGKEDIYDSFAGTSWSGESNATRIQLDFAPTANECSLTVSLINPEIPKQANKGSVSVIYNYSIEGYDEALISPDGFICSKNNNTLTLKDYKTREVKHILRKQ